jgi:hypothetical protein
VILRSAVRSQSKATIAEPASNIHAVSRSAPPMNKIASAWATINIPENVGPPRSSFKYSIKCLPIVCFYGLQGAA